MERLEMKTFSMVHMYLRGTRPPEVFTEETAPDWLTSKNTTRGATMDQRWFWEQHVLTLTVGQSIDTDFQTITRIQ